MPFRAGAAFMAAAVAASTAVWPSPAVAAGDGSPPAHPASTTGSQPGDDGPAEGYQDPPEFEPALPGDDQVEPALPGDEAPAPAPAQPPPAHVPTPPAQVPAPPAQAPAPPPHAPSPAPVPPANAPALPAPTGQPPVTDERKAGDRRRGSSKSSEPRRGIGVPAPRESDLSTGTAPFPTHAAAERQSRGEQDSPVSPRSSHGASRHGHRVHVVRSGETLWSIASGLLPREAPDARVAHVVDQLWRLNAGAIASGDPDVILPGQALRLPA